MYNLNNSTIEPKKKTNYCMYTFIIILICFKDFSSVFRGKRNQESRRVFLWFDQRYQNTDSMKNLILYKYLEVTYNN